MTETYRCAECNVKIVVEGPTKESVEFSAPVLCQKCSPEWASLLDNKHNPRNKPVVKPGIIMTEVERRATEEGYDKLAGGLGRRCEMTCVFQLRDGWHAIWNGRTAAATFNCKGAAEAWINICNRLGRWRT